MKPTQDEQSEMRRNGFRPEAVIVPVAVVVLGVAVGMTLLSARRDSREPPRGQRGAGGGDAAVRSAPLDPDIEASPVEDPAVAERVRRDRIAGLERKLGALGDTLRSRNDLLVSLKRRLVAGGGDEALRQARRELKPLEQAYVAFLDDHPQVVELEARAASLEKQRLSLDRELAARLEALREAKAGEEAAQAEARSALMAERDARARELVGDRDPAEVPEATRTAVRAVYDDYAEKLAQLGVEQRERLRNTTGEARAALEAYQDVVARIKANGSERKQVELELPELRRTLTRTDPNLRKLYAEYDAAKARLNEVAAADPRTAELAAEIGALRSEMAALRAELAALRGGHHTASDPGTAGQGPAEVSASTNLTPERERKGA